MKRKIIGHKKEYFGDMSPEEIEKFELETNSVVLLAIDGDTFLNFHKSTAGSGSVVILIDGLKYIDESRNPVYGSRLGAIEITLAQFNALSAYVNNAPYGGYIKENSLNVFYGKKR
jgi:hypothetical protein